VHHVGASLVIDGHPSERAWKSAPWTDLFVDIEGNVRPAPKFATRAKMLYDDHYWYIAAEIQEPDLWATIREHDAVIFQDNDFELFIDPSGSAARYFEIEVNQFGTEWDLFLPKAYRDGGHAVNSWEMPGLKLATSLQGTINHPGDRDRGWMVEIAMPWAAFADSGRNVVPPAPGIQWRMNFSRVEWDADTVSGRYVRRRDAAGKLLPEHNWVWSPQGVVNMHVPEKWGVVTFQR
jgi:Carbohydrate family 9 binding domain-like